MSDPASVPRPHRSPVAGLALAAAVIAAVTALLYPISELDPGVSSGVLYVLGVLLLATYWGLWLGLVTSVASAVALDFFHTHPTGRLLADRPEDLVAICMLLLTTVVASVIADRARRSESERVRLREVRASRARVLEAADRERRRVARDLHDGAQQRLVHTVITLKLASRELADGPARTLVGEALDHAERATHELRELAHGILPAVLVRGGLHAGVDALASRMPVPVAVDVPATRFPAAVEATAYFVVAEGLTNVAKHARARAAWVTVTPYGRRLAVEVRDDGVGGADPGASGLLGMADRLAALDGRLAIESAPGSGTRVVASIPLHGPAPSAV